MTAYEQMGLQYIRQISPDMELGCRFQTLVLVQPSQEETQKRQTKIKDISFEVSTQVDEANYSSTWLNNFNSYAMMVECHLETNGLKVRIGFDSQGVEKTQVQCMAWHLEHVLRGICAAESGPLTIRDVCGVSREDLRQLARWTGACTSWWRSGAAHSPMHPPCALGTVTSHTPS